MTNTPPLNVTMTAPGPTPWPHFPFNELACHCGCNTMVMSRSFMAMLEELRLSYGAPITISSGYRCPKYNNAVSKSGSDGVHTTGLAVDIAIRGRDADKLLRLAVKMGFGGIGIKQAGASRYLHLDMVPDGEKFPRPIIWTY